MHRTKIASLLALFSCATLGAASPGQKMKVIVDQDTRGPATTDLQSILVFLQSEQFDVLGITTVTGDQWVDEETAHALRLLEIAGRIDVPVIKGAKFPLLNSKEESERWDALYGRIEYKGCWTDWSTRPAVPAAYAGGYHDPDVIPPLPEGEPKLQARPGTAAQFIVETVRKYPGEVTLWAGGPLTNIALALRLDPEVATLARQLVLMGSGMYSDIGGVNTIDGRREFNWWFDPEAARIVMRSPWKKITITPVDISVKASLTPQVHDAIAHADTPVARYLTRFSGQGYMWDEISAAALADPSVITSTRELYVDVEINHGPSYGETLFWSKTAHVPPYERLAVQFDLDKAKFYDLYVKLMTKPPAPSKLGGSVR